MSALEDSFEWINKIDRDDEMCSCLSGYMNDRKGQDEGRAKIKYNIR